MAKNKEIVTFLMPDGTEVSNDPRWVEQEAADAMETVLSATPNRGKAGADPDEQLAAQGGGVSSPQSGQPGVGEAATFESTEEVYANRLTGRDLQVDDSDRAEERGVDPGNPKHTPPEPVDSNQRVQDVRDKREAQRKAALEALAEDGQQEGDPDQPYEKWTSKQLKARVATLRAEGTEVDTSGVKKKADLAERIREAEQPS